MTENKALSLRERQSLLGKEAILDTAFQLFTTQGYDKTTVQNIADAAGVGVATVFRHFRSKLGVMAGLIRRDLKPVFEKGEEILASPPKKPVDALILLLENFSSIMDAPSQTIKFRTRRRAIVHPSKIEIIELIAYSDGEIQKQIKSLLLHFRKQSLLNNKLDIDHMTIVIFQIYHTHIMEVELDHDHGRNVSKDKIMKLLKARIRILFEPWLKRTTK